MPKGTLTPPNEELKALGVLFQRRLQEDLLTLGSLAARFAGTELVPGTVLEEIRFFAHRLQGAAAIFEAHELARSAQALEAAAALAGTGSEPNAPPSVSSTLQGLLAQLSQRIDKNSNAAGSFGAAHPK
jgi:HPt (histidine-containing phosphotransfer) domain-containing protein